MVTSGISLRASGPKKASNSRSASPLIAATLAVPLAMGGAGSAVRAGASFWNVPTNGNWTVGSNWLNGVPVSGSDAYVEHTDNFARTVTYNYTGGSIQFDSLQLDHAGNGVTEFAQIASNTTFNAFYEIVGAASSLSSPV